MTGVSLGRAALFWLNTCQAKVHTKKIKGPWFAPSLKRGVEMYDSKCDDSNVTHTSLHSEQYCWVRQWWTFPDSKTWKLNIWIFIPASHAICRRCLFSAAKQHRWRHLVPGASRAVLFSFISFSLKQLEPNRGSTDKYQTRLTFRIRNQRVMIWIRCSVGGKKGPKSRRIFPPCWIYIARMGRTNEHTNDGWFLTCQSSKSKMSILAMIFKPSSIIIIGL